MSPYIVGIDLGTTNIAVSYIDTAAESTRPEPFHIPQIVAEGECDTQPTLPSFIFLAGAVNENYDLPWASGRNFCVGALARMKASATPGKTVSSAKSWLCSATVDRLAPVLPWNNDDAEGRISPVDASRMYLEHIRDAWNHTMADDVETARLENQEIVLTVPASFDAVARDLTVNAAEAAGLSVTLLEEPQAAFYAWLQEHDDRWRDTIAAGDRVLVCDIGGGTTDFSLIEVADEDGDLGLRRVAVGKHILLGGDNLDLTLAYALAARLQRDRNIKLDAYQLAGLTHACRDAKETLCQSPDAPAQKIAVLGRGSSVIGGMISTELSFDDVVNAVIDGFFPFCFLNDRPTAQTRAGLRQFGLAYEADPAVTRHLADFVSTHSGTDEDATNLPNAILFNGGVTKAGILKDRIVQTVQRWVDETDGELVVLDGANPDLAVAQGAAWYGLVRRGDAIRIKSGSSHAYYVGIESSMPAVPGFSPPLQALCVVPFGLEEGSEVDVPYSGLGLIVGETTEFRFYASSTRTSDATGVIINDVDTDDVVELPALTAELPVDDSGIPPGAMVPVRLKTILSEIGTLQLWCLEEAGERRWKLEYEVRTAVSDTDAT